MALTNEILARLAQWARQIEAHDWRADALTPRDFTADLAALGESLAAKDRAIEDLIVGCSTSFSPGVAAVQPVPAPARRCQDEIDPDRRRR
jgi:hypothetical protein